MTTPATRPARASKLSTMDDAVRLVEPGMTIAVGGFWNNNQPNAFARALVRAGLRGLRLTGPPVGGYAHDLLIGAGVVDRLLTPHISFDALGLSPNLRWAAESGALSVDECEEACLIGGFRAAAQHLDALPVRSLTLTEVVEHSSLVRQSDGRLADREAVAVRPDVAVVHVGCADAYGNGCHLTTPFADRLIARVAQRVVLTAERIVHNDEIRADPRHTTILGLWVDAVVEAPGGAAPGACHGVYPEDTDGLLRYLQLGEARRKGDPKGYESYLEGVRTG
jgi:glutaconate CoA-transferase subunit A